MKVYVVMTGMYDTYGLGRVFSTREKAEAFAKEHEADYLARNNTTHVDWDGYTEIEEVEVDA